jgi:hypothetical protein
MSYVDQTSLREALTRYYSEGELRTLCFDLGIDFESLGGRGKANNARELVHFAIRQGRYDDLVAYVRRTRPHAPLTMSDAPPQPPAANENPAGGGQAAVYQVQGDYIQGDRFGGDKVEGDKNTVGDLSGGNVAIGAGASAGNTTNKVEGNVIGGVVGGGTVNAENIAGGDISVNPNPQSKADFAHQLEELKTLLEKAIADGEFADTDDGNDAVDDLNKAIRETGKDEPRAKQVQKRLESAAELIQSGAKAGTAVLKATPIIAGLIKTAGMLF